MPELPEVETSVRALKGFQGKILKNISVTNPHLRWKLDTKNIHALENLVVEKIFRRAKCIVLEFSDFFHLLHLGMTGTLRIQEASSNRIEKHDHIVFHFQDKSIVFNDTRKFGYFKILSKEAYRDFDRQLGPEPLSASFSASYLQEKISKSNAAIKNLIMNQHVVVGVGNIYANEALFISNVHPMTSGNKLKNTEIDKLVKAIKQVLKKAIALGGTTLKDFYSPEGNKGYFKIKLKVYGNDNQPCPNCGKPISRIVVGQRASFLCNKCQKLR